MKPFRVGDWRVEPTLNQIVRADDPGSVTKLEPKAMEVLSYLAARAGEVVDKESVIADVWQGAFVTNEVLTNAVWELRRALGDDAKSSIFIQTIPKRGYRLVAPVTFEDAPEATSPRRFFLPAGAVSLAALAWLLWPRADTNPGTVARFAVDVAEPLGPFYLTAVALSPDASRLAYATAGEGIYIRPVDRLESTLVPGTKGAVGPLFSPDGSSLAFHDGGKLRSVRLGEESPARDVAFVGAARGAAWGEDGFLYFTRGSNDGLARARADGADVEVLTTLDEESGEWTHRWPDVLPGARAVLFTVARRDLRSFDDAEIHVLDLESRERRILIEGGAFARFLPGRIVYARGSDLLGIPFDDRALEVRGEPRTVLKDVKTYPINGAAHFSFSRDGSLAYVPGVPARETPRRLVSVARDGTVTPIAEDERLFYDPAISRDGSRIAVSIVTDGNSDLWLYDTSRKTLTRLTSTGGEEEHPVFSPDGRTLAYDYSMAGPFRILSRPVDGSGEEKELVRSEWTHRAESFSPGGDTLLFTTETPRSGFDLWRLRLDGELGTEPFLATPFDERFARISPDGRFVAYSSNESGRFEAYVTTFPEPGPRLQVSVDGGWHPSWTREGSELVFLTEGALMAVSVRTSPDLTAGKPEKLFSWRPPLPPLESDYRRYYDAALDGERFIFVEIEEDPSARRLHVVLGWSSEL